MASYSVGGTWHVDDGASELPAGVTFVSYVSPGESLHQLRRQHPDRARWFDVFVGGERRDRAPLPACVAKVWWVEGRWHVFLDDPVFIDKRISDKPRPSQDSGRHDTEPSEAALLNLVTHLRRWPTLERVEVEDLLAATASICEVLSKQGFPAVVTPPQVDVEKVSWHGPESWRHSKEGEPVHWSVWMTRTGWGAPGFEPTFGQDEAALADFVQRVRPTGPLPVVATPARLRSLGLLLDARGVPWRRSSFKDQAPIVGEPVHSGGLSMQLTIDGYGWMKMALAIPGERLDLTISRGTADGFTELVQTVQTAVIEHRAAYCDLDEEPVSHHLLLLPGTTSDEIRLEVWRQPDGHLRDAAPRDGELKARWSGSSRHLATVTAGAVQSLLTAAGPYGVADRWGSPPPHDQLHALETWITTAS